MTCRIESMKCKAALLAIVLLAGLSACAQGWGRESAPVHESDDPER